MIKLQNVNKYFNKRKANEIHVINDTSLELPENGIVTLLGPSGCGKTTLLNAVGGLDKVNSGKIFIDDACITGMRSGKVDAVRNAKIGYIFQNFNLLDNKTVFENVAIALRMIGIKDKEMVASRVNYCLKAVGIYKYRNKTTDALSGGQRQRVAIARAIVKNPRIIIADEPTGNLDSSNTIEIMNIIKTISKERLVLLVTHERKIAEFYSSRIIDLKDGKVVGIRENDTEKFLDYELENKIYLKDMPVHRRMSYDDTDVNIYSDGIYAADIKLVLRGGNIYIDTGGKFNVIDSESNIELIDDHYSAMDASIYEKNQFQYDKYMPKNHEPKYTALFTPFSMITDGFKTIRGFKILKKLLLVGFVFASIFTFTALSNIFGVLNIKEKDFLTTNRHYVTVANSNKDTGLTDTLKSKAGVKYALPSDTQIALDLPLTEYLQSSDYLLRFSGSVTPASQLKKANIKFGKLPENNREIVIDKQITDRFFKEKTIQQVGINSAKQLINRKIKIKQLGEFSIAGISNTNSPSVFISDDMCLPVLMYSDKSAALTPPTIETAKGVESQASDGEEDSHKANEIMDYAYRPESLKIVKGKAPANDYEIIVNTAHAEEMPLNKATTIKLDNHYLKVSGYYTTDTPSVDNYFTTANTLKQKYLAKQNKVSLYADDVHALADRLEADGYNVEINYDRDKSSYTNAQYRSIRGSLALAGIMALIALIEMYLMLRSSFLSRIKEVGTMRAIGIKKLDIYRMFIGEILVMTILTAIPGIAAAYYVIKYSLAQYSSKFLIEPKIAFLTFAIILLFNLIAGLIPVFRTIRKTPAAILSRTDI